MSEAQNQLGLMRQLQSATKTFWNQPFGVQVRSAKQTAHLKRIHAEHTADGIAKYKALLSGKDWCATGYIEQLAGCPATAATSFLRKLLELGYIERRPRGNTERYIKNRGWEWRWK